MHLSLLTSIFSHLFQVFGKLWLTKRNVTRLSPSRLMASPKTKKWNNSRCVGKEITMLRVSFNSQAQPPVNQILEERAQSTPRPITKSSVKRLIWHPKQIDCVTVKCVTTTYQCKNRYKRSMARDFFSFSCSVWLLHLDQPLSLYLVTSASSYPKYDLRQIPLNWRPNIHS